MRAQIDQREVQAELSALPLFDELLGFRFRDLNHTSDCVFPPRLCSRPRNRIESSENEDDLWVVVVFLGLRNPA